MVTTSTYRMQTKKGWVMSLPQSSPWTITATFTTYSITNYQPGQLALSEFNTVEPNSLIN